MRIKKVLGLLGSLPKTVYFNFHYLPFHQAIKLPILLRNPRFINLKGKIILDCPQEKIRFAMIRLGVYVALEVPYLPVRLDILGAIIFKGSCWIGTNSCLQIGKKGTLIFGDNFLSSSGMTLACYHRIEFKENVRVGWGVQIMDTDLHAMQKVAATSGEGLSEKSVETGNYYYI